MELLQSLLEELFGQEQCGGTTVGVAIQMSSPTHCSGLTRLSDYRGAETGITFDPPLPLEEALVRARRYNENARFIDR